MCTFRGRGELQLQKAPCKEEAAQTQLKGKIVQKHGSSSALRACVKSFIMIPMRSLKQIFDYIKAGYSCTIASLSFKLVEQAAWTAKVMRIQQGLATCTWDDGCLLFVLDLFTNNSTFFQRSYYFTLNSSGNQSFGTRRTRLSNT